MKHCFEILGLVPIASPPTLGPASRELIRTFYKERDYEPILEIAENYRSFEDRPWNMWEMYRYLDARFPDSRFVLTVRDPESWWRSTEQWVTVSKPQILNLYQLHLRVPNTNKESMVESYLRYNQEVIDYFRGTDKLLQMNFENDDEWSKLCSFLGVPLPDRKFPHANRQSYSTKDTKLLRKRRKLKTGVECQSCGYVTPVKKHLPNRIRKAKNRFRKRPGPAALAQLIKLTLFRQMKAIYARCAQFLFYGFRSIRTVLRWPFQLTRRRMRPQGSAQAPGTDDFAVVSCFFNPGGSQRRIKNFEAFLSGIKASGVRCLVVELAFSSRPFQFGDHEDVIQLRTSDIMWHKERLLNIGISRLLSEGYEKIAWMDGDIIFDDPDWHRVIAAKLDTARLCQVFGTVAIQGDRNSWSEVGPSAVKYFHERGTLYNQSPKSIRGLIKGRLRGGQSGFGWAARAEVLRKVMLYENAIVGGGDKMIFLASLAPNFTTHGFQALTVSSFSCSRCGHRNMSSAYSSSYLEWANRWADAVDKQVDYADLNIRDMYHGDRKDRKYLARRDILFKHQFNPAEDLTLDASGCLAWASEKKNLHHDVESYFLSRREDV